MSKSIQTKLIKESNMDKSKEIWWFDRLFAFEPVDGPFTVTGVITGSGGPLLVSTKGIETYYIPEKESYPTKNEALIAHYRFNEKRITKRRKELDESMRDLKKYYSEEYRG